MCYPCVCLKCYPCLCTLPTLTLSRSTGEGTARLVVRRFRRARIPLPMEDDSPSPIRWERVGVRVNVFQNPKLFLHEPLRKCDIGVSIETRLQRFRVIHPI